MALPHVLCHTDAMHCTVQVFVLKFLCHTTPRNATFSSTCEAQCLLSLECRSVRALPTMELPPRAGRLPKHCTDRTCHKSAITRARTAAVSGDPRWNGHAKRWPPKRSCGSTSCALNFHALQKPTPLALLSEVPGNVTRSCSALKHATQNVGGHQQRSATHEHLESVSRMLPRPLTRRPTFRFAALGLKLLCTVDCFP